MGNYDDIKYDDIIENKKLLFAYDLFTCFSEFFPNNRIVTCTKATLKLMKSIYAFTRMSSDEWFRSGKWNEYCPEEFGIFIYEILDKYYDKKQLNIIKEKSMWSSNTSKYYEIKLKSGIIGAVHSSTGKGCTLWFPTENTEEVLAEIGDIIWQDIGSKMAIFVRQDIEERWRKEFILEPARYDIKESDLADQMCNYINKYVSHGMVRQILLWGTPGTGKSTLARMIMAKLNLRTLYVPTNLINMIDISCLRKAKRLFRYDAILIDDLDSANGYSSDILDIFDNNGLCKLVICTANNKDKLGERLLRPGRFDEIVEVTELGDDTIKQILGEQNADVFDKVKHWPICYIQEFCKRAKICGKEVAVSEIQSLQERILKAKEKMNIEAKPAQAAASTK